MDSAPVPAPAARMAGMISTAVQWLRSMLSSALERRHSRSSDQQLGLTAVLRSDQITPTILA